MGTGVAVGVGVNVGVGVSVGVAVGPRDANGPCPFLPSANKPTPATSKTITTIALIRPITKPLLLFCGAAATEVGACACVGAGAYDCGAAAGCVEAGVSPATGIAVVGVCGCVCGTCGTVGYTIPPGYAGADPWVSGYCGAVCTPEEAAVADVVDSSFCAAGSFAAGGVAAGV